MLTVVASYTIGAGLVGLVTGSKNEVVIHTATVYLKFNTVFYCEGGHLHFKKCNAGAWRAYHSAGVEFP